MRENGDGLQLGERGGIWFAKLFHRVCDQELKDFIKLIV